MNIVCSLIIKGLAMLVSILIIPAFARYFSQDTAYGAWITVSSVFTWMTMFDFGIGNGLRNYLVKSLSANDDKASAQYISSAYISVGAISLFFAAAGAVLIYFLDWNALLKVPAELISPQTFRIYIEIVYMGVVVHFFFLLINSVCYALQKTFLPSLFALLTQGILLIWLYIPNGTSLETKIIELSATHLLAYNLPVAIATLLLFGKRLRNMRPQLSAYSKDITKQIIRLGSTFFFIQLGLIALNSSNEIYINIFFEAKYVVQYQYYYKLFYVIIILLTLVLQPIWSAITKAYCEGRMSWIRKTYALMNVLAAALSLGSALLALFYQPIADLWLGKGVLTVSPSEIWPFCLFTSMYLFIMVTNSVSNGLGKLKYQTVFMFVGAILKYVIIFIGNRVFDVGWELVIIANVIALIPFLVGHTFYISRVLSVIDKKEIDERSEL